MLFPLGWRRCRWRSASAILRYRLYEIDRLISRTLSYAILTALLVGTFIGLVALTTDTLALSGRVGVAASTLAAAALFNPLRMRIQRLVDRRFNRARYDAEATVAAFTRTAARRGRDRRDPRRPARRRQPRRAAGARLGLDQAVNAVLRRMLAGWKRASRLRISCSNGTSPCMPRAASWSRTVDYVVAAPEEDVFHGW